MKPLSTIRTDVVGSLLRPAHLKQAYAQRDEGKITEDDLHRIEDEAIRKAVQRQESLGLDVVTDGEFRRLNFQDSFAASVSGFYFAHPEARYYAVDLITRDQVESYAARKRMPISDVERWLAANLAYEA